MKITANSTNQEIVLAFGGTTDNNGRITNFGKLSDCHPRCIYVSEETTGPAGWRHILFVQLMKNVPQRSNNKGNNEIFALQDALAKEFNISRVSSADGFLGRAYQQMDPSMCDFFAANIGKPISNKKFNLVITDSFDPEYDSQEPAKKDGKERLHKGRPFYTSTKLKPCAKPIHTIFKDDAPNANISSTNANEGIFAEETEGAYGGAQQLFE